MKLGKFGSQQKETEDNQHSNDSITKESEMSESEQQICIPIEIGADGIAILSLSGKIDALCFSSIQEKAVSLLEQNNVVGLAFDMKNVSYVSSAGLRMFAAVHKKAVSAGKSYKLTQIRGDIYKLFQMTGYTSAFCLEVQTEE